MEILNDEQLETVTEYTDKYANNFNSASEAYDYFYNSMLASINNHQTEF